MDEHDESASSPAPRPAAAASPLAGLRERRAKVRQALHLDLAVPRYDPPVYVRFKPVSDARVSSINKTLEKSKDPEKVVLANARVLAEACVGVFEVDGDGDPVSIDPEDREGDWPRFDERLGQLLGIADAAAATVVIRELYATDGDIISTATRLAEWSGYSLAELEERSGN